MKRIKRVVDIGFWSDEKVMDFSPEDKYFMLFLLTNEFTSQLGIYYLPIKRAAFDLGYAEEAVRVLLDRFENKYKMIRYSALTSEVAVKNYLNYSIVSGGKPVLDLLISETKTVKDKALLEYMYENINKNSNNETVKKFLVWLSGFLKESTKENSSHNDNDNDNDNEESCTNRTRIADESSTNRQPKPNMSKAVDSVFDLYEEICISLPRCISRSDRRKKMIKKRLEKFTIDDFKRMFEAAEASDFLTGRDDKWGGCGLDWLLNETNMVKVLEGNYVNRGKSRAQPKNKFNNFNQRQYDFDELEKKLLGNTEGQE